MSEFRPYSLFYDALSGEFAPPSDPHKRRHTLGRLSTATVQKGRGPEYCRDYVPSWAPDSYAMVQTSLDPDLVKNIDSQLIIAESTLVKPLVYTFADYRPRATTAPAGEHELVIMGKGLEIVRALELGPRLDAIRQEVADIAQDFYNSFQK